MMKITHAAFFHPEASWREKRSPITWKSRMKKMTMKKITISDHRKVRNVVATGMRLLYWSCGLGAPEEPGGHDNRHHHESPRQLQTRPRRVWVRPSWAIAKPSGVVREEVFSHGTSG